MDKKDMKVIIANNLKTYRQKAGLKQKDVAAVLNTDSSTLSKFESGAREPDWTTLQKMADLYGVSYIQLVGGEAKEINDKEIQRIVELLESLNDEQRETALAMLYGLEYKIRLEERRKQKSQ